MKTTLRILAMLLAATGPALTVDSIAADKAPAEAAPAQPSQQYPQAPQAPPKRTWQSYDLTTVETVSGDVIKVDTIQRRGGRYSAIHLVVATHGGETIDILLGPSYFLDKQPVRIGEKDSIEVTGSRIAGTGGKPAIIAATVRKGNEVLKLREADGTPLWRHKRSCE